MNHASLDCESFDRVVCKKIEKEIATSNSKRTIASKNKWHTTNDIISITYMNVCKTRF